MNNIYNINKFFLFIICMLVLLIGCTTKPNEINRLSVEIYAKGKIQDPKPPHDFKSDGCSCFPDSDWVECCVMHDLAYWMGGTSEERKDADRALRKCVADKGYPKTGALMYYGVRVGGVWWLPTSFRWGFGWDYPKSGPPGKPY